MEHAVKLTTTTSGRIAGSKKQIGVALYYCWEKKQWVEKNTTSQEKLLVLVNKIKAITAICIAFTAFFL